MEKLNLDKKTLKKFGITMGIAFSLITILLIIRHKYSILPTSVISLVFFVFTLIAPNLLRPIYIIWMRLAFMLGWINTRLILFIMFYLIFTPIGLAIRLLRVDLLDRKIYKNRKSYWRKKEGRVFNPLDYEKQF